MIGVVGMGRSGEAAARLAMKNGLPVRLLEHAQDAAAQQKAAVLRAMGAELRLGAHQPDMLEGLRQIVVSPGVPASSQIFAWCRARGIPVAGEMEWASRQFEGRIIAVTGTNGKTTTTALLTHLLRENGISAEACGNIGLPLSQVLLSGQTPQYVVAEISSFQLETIETFHPAIALFLNFTPDHLDRHPNLQDYWNAKIRLFMNQSRGDWALIHADLRERLKPLLSAQSVAFATFGMISAADIHPDDGALCWSRVSEGPLCGRRDIPLIGDHNVENASAAAAAAYLCGLSPEAIGKAMRSFRAVDHRLQPVGKVGAVRFVNDSKATNTDSLAVALKAFGEKVVLIAGGRHKNQDFSPLKALVREKVASAVLIGEGADKMLAAWQGATPMQRARDMRQAVEMAWGLAQSSGAADTVLLSPACASFDMFRNYEERGRVFVQCVQALAERGAHDSYAQKV